MIPLTPTRGLIPWKPMLSQTKTDTALILTSVGFPGSFSVLKSRKTIKHESHSSDFFLVDDGCFEVGRKIGKIYNRSTAESTTTYVSTVRNLPTTATDDHAHNRGDLSTTSYSTTIYNFARLSLRLSAPPLFLKHGESNQKAIVNDGSDR